MVHFQYSVVKFHDRRPKDEQDAKLFFIFFEWKNDIIEKSYLVYTTTPWSIGAGLCGVFLTLHRGYQLAQTSYKRVQKDKARRSIRKRTIREMRKQMSSRQASRTDSDVEPAAVWISWREREPNRVESEVEDVTIQYIFQHSASFNELTSVSSPDMLMLCAKWYRMNVVDRLNYCWEDIIAWL